MEKPALEGGDTLLALCRRHLEGKVYLVKLVHIRHTTPLGAGVHFRAGPPARLTGSGLDQ
jgi:hypothetical protein